MSGKNVKINSKRVFAEEFKRARVKEYEKGTFTVNELSKLYHIQTVVLYRWIYKYSAYNKRSIKVVEMSESSQNKVKQLQKRIEELERIVGQKQLNIDFLEQMIALAGQEYGIDIKKNSSTPPSASSGKTSGK
jgi:transposase